MQSRNVLLILTLSTVSLSASAAVTLSCSLTHSMTLPGQQSAVSLVNRHSTVIDKGNSFTFSTDGQKNITSPALQPVKMDNGETVQAAKVNDLTFVKLKDSYVLRNKRENYVWLDCKPTS